MPASEHLVHFGLSTSGGGSRPAAAVSRNLEIAERVEARSPSSSAMRTRSREPAYHIAPSVTL